MYYRYYTVLYKSTNDLKSKLDPDSDPDSDPDHRFVQKIAIKKFTKVVNIGALKSLIKCILTQKR